MNEEFKIENKPTLWVANLRQGCYSDKEEQQLYFRGNSPEEVWSFLGRYFSVTQPTDQYQTVRALVWGAKQISFKPPEQEVDWGTNYGDAWEVEIFMLPVVYFQK